MLAESSESQAVRTPARWPLALMLFMLFALALGIRLYDLTDPPNDFYLVRQYRSLLIARGMYYEHLTTIPDWQRDVAVAQWKQEELIEPPIMEILASFIYRAFGDYYWIGRVLSTLVWLVGSIAIWLLAKELSLRGGGIIALAYFLFLPFGVKVSRAFMPDPLMTALIAWSLWALYRWNVQRTWRSAFLAGILTGVAILVKSVAVFPLLGAAFGLVLSRRPLIQTLKDRQVWSVAGITAIPTLLYYFYGMVIVGTLGSQFSLRFFPSLLADPSFYVRWLFLAAGLGGFAAVFASLTGILFFREKSMRLMTIGLWIGYILYGVAFPFHIITHEYYHAPLIPIVAIGLIPVMDSLVQPLAQQKSRVSLAVFTGLFIFAILMKMWDSRNYMVLNSYRHEIAYWQELGQDIGYDKNVIELSGDYGVRLAYFGWINGSQWPNTADIQVRDLAGQEQPDFASMFTEYTSGKDLFVITSFSEWEKQADLRKFLTAYYTLIQQGDGYLIFDLHQSVSP